MHAYHVLPDTCCEALFVEKLIDMQWVGDLVFTPTKLAVCVTLRVQGL